METYSPWQRRYSPSWDPCFGAMTDFKKLKVVELRAELASRGLLQAGKRDELIERLEEYEFEHGDLPAANENRMDTEETEDYQMQDAHGNGDTGVTPTNGHLSPVQHSENQESLDRLTAEAEEEKRAARARRFGLDAAEQTPVKIEVTLKGLEHALPNRHHKHKRQNK